MKQTNFINEFDRKYGDSYRNEQSTATNPAHVLPGEARNGESGFARNEELRMKSEEYKLPVSTEGNPYSSFRAEGAIRHSSFSGKATLFDHPVVDYVNAMLPGGAPVGARHDCALRLASDAIILLDGDVEAVRSLLGSLKWVQDIVTERGQTEIDRIIDAAQKRMQKREAENLYSPQPSKEMRRAIRQVTGRDYAQLKREQRAQATGLSADEADETLALLERVGNRLKSLLRYYVLLTLFTANLKLRHYPAATFVGGGFAMTLLTRMWYRFWAEPSRRCRLNSIIELIGRSGSGKHIAVDLYRIMMEPVKRDDQRQIDALNQWNAEREQKSGGEKNKVARPKGILRCLPSEASAAAIREAEFNAKEVIDGEEWPLHVSQFNSELDDLLAQQKKSYMNIEALFLKSLHNEPAGSFLKTSSSMVGEYDVHFNGVYTGTEDALSRQNTTQNFARGLLQRLGVVPMGDTQFEMRQMRKYTDADRQREAQLHEWASRLNACVGEIPAEDISNALYRWTERRMADAREEQSKPLEDLVKRPCWIAMNLALPFIIARHWDQMEQGSDGRWHCGPSFKTDKHDRALALTLADAQLAFQQLFFLSTGEKLYEERAAIQASAVHPRQRTLLAYRRLPELFTAEDVDREYGYQGNRNSINGRVKRLQDDGLAQRIRQGEHKGMLRKLA